MTELTTAELAERIGGRLEGDGSVRVGGVAALDLARPHEVSFLANRKYLSQVMESRAGAVIVPEDYTEAPPAGRAWIVSADPSVAFSEAVELFAPAPVQPPAGVHPQAFVATSAEVPASAHVGAFAVVEEGVKIGENTAIMAGCYIGHETRVGADCLLYPNVTVRERCLIGDRVIIHPAAVIGADGFGFEPSPQGHRKIPQRGIVQIDDDAEIGACTTIDRARFGRTWVQRGVKIDNLVQLGHNVVVGEHSGLMAQVGIAGSTRIGRLVAMYGQAGANGHITIGDGAQILGRGGVWNDIPPEQISSGVPAMPHREYLRQQATLRKLPELLKRLRALEAEVDRLKRDDD